MNKRIFLLSLFCFSLGISVLRAADPLAGTPQQFKATIGGFFGASYWVELKDGSIYYTVKRADSTKKDDPVIIKPTDAQWQEFGKTLDGLGAWKWQPSYRSDAFDGTQWTLDIVIGDRKIQAKGSNSYPEADGKPGKGTQQTATFNSYLAAVQKLLGGKAFR